MNSAKSDSAEPAPSLSPAPVRIAALVVTCNRFALLQENIAALRAQTRPLDAIFVVNNGCTDGTAEWLKNQADLTVITQSNQGSSGGQATGIAAAVQAGFDWVWCMDDDTIPEPAALEMLVTSPVIHDPKTGFLSSLVVWTDGTPHEMNIQPPRYPAKWYHKVMADGVIPVETASFVATMVSRSAVATVGLPLRDLFIWYDDLEYTRRISTQFQGYAVLTSRVLHKTPVNAGPAVDRISAKDAWKYCYGARNQMFIFRTSSGSWIRRTVRMTSLYWQTLMKVLRRKAPFKLLWWCTKGIWYRPRVEFP